VKAPQESIHLIAATVGSISFLLLWLAVLWGLVLRNGWLLTRIRHATVYGIHQSLALAGLCLAAVHACAQFAVPGGHVRPVDVVVPFLNGLDPVGIGVGVVALELMTAAALSVLVQRRLGYSRWRALHTMTYCAFLLMVGHVLLSGSDTGSVAAYGTVVACTLATGVAWLASTAWIARVRRRTSPSSAPGKQQRTSTVDVDAHRCARFGFCEQAAPEVFTLRGDGRLAYRASVSDDEIGAVINAVEVCPARAITLRRIPTSVLTPPRPEPDGADADDDGPEESGFPGIDLGTVTGIRRGPSGHRTHQAHRTHRSRR
jgi:sulfoxide reductase heme-binding subunit YedZ